MCMDRMGTFGNCAFSEAYCSIGSLGEGGCGGREGMERAGMGVGRPVKSKI